MKTENAFKAEVRNLLDQFGQAILYGPPGTGKTRLARGVAAEILDLASADKLEEEKERFQFVQFHPSYNYEDFVRGIRMETDDNGRVAYKTENRVFGKMAERALANEGEPHVLVIDEINRANVSAVLGELIYGLEMEYRGKEVQTPYEVDGGYGLIVPSNLKVIGTMNTADRTIGQIDYAVRRRFAFVQCRPVREVVKNIGGPRAPEFFDLVDKVFEHLSLDHDKEDVCIGHSYFLASGPELANKIIYQVVPILREYLKDGVLGKEAEPKIDAIKEAAKELGKSVRVEEKPSVSASGMGWRWTHVKSDTRHNPPSPANKSINPFSLRQMVLSLVRDYALVNGKPETFAELQGAFPNKFRKGHGVVRLADDSAVTQHERDRYFRDLDDQIQLPDGSRVVVCGEWEKEFFTKEFRGHLAGLGYEIRQDRSTVVNDPYWAVNVGERRHRPHRNWDNCRQYGFLSGGQGDAPAKYLGQIPRGAIVFAYISGFGYVGCGKVMDEATTIGEFLIGETFKPLSDVLDAATPRDDHDPEKEFAIRVKWLGTPRAREQGVLSKYSYPKTASPIQDAERLRALKSEFGIADENDGAN